MRPGYQARVRILLGASLPREGRRLSRPTQERLKWLREQVEAADEVVTVNRDRTVEWDVRGDVLDLLEAHTWAGYCPACVARERPAEPEEEPKE